MKNLEFREEIIHSTRCIVSIIGRRVEIAMCAGSRRKFRGKNKAEAELQMWNYLHSKPTLKGESAITEERVKILLGTLDMPESHIRISSEHYKQNQIYTNSFTVRRSVGADGKIYFGTYHNEHAAKSASIRLCELINEEIDRRHFVRKSTAPEELPLKRRKACDSVRHQLPVMEKQMVPMTLEYE